MKLWVWLRWLGYNVLALYMMSLMMGNDSADALFLCFYKQWCDKHLFKNLKRCWFILAPESKTVIQKCVMSTCGLHLPVDFTMQDLCGDKISFSKKKECFFVCTQKFIQYAIKLEQEAPFTSTYEMLWHTKNCFNPYFEICSYVK